MPQRILLQDDGRLQLESPDGPKVSCDDPDVLWGVSGGAMVTICLFAGMVLGILLGVGAMYLLQRRMAKAVKKKQVPGGWRISTLLAKDNTVLTPQTTQGASGHRHKESLDDGAFANILSKTMQVLGASSVSSLGHRNAVEQTQEAPPHHHHHHKHHLQNGSSNAGGAPGRGATRPPASAPPPLPGAATPAKQLKPKGGLSVETDDVVVHETSTIRDSASGAPSTRESLVRTDNRRRAVEPVAEEPAKAAADSSPSSSIESEYDLDDLDDEWMRLLQSIDDLMMEQGKPTMVSQERAVAIRSLLAAAEDESLDQAVQRAVCDVEATRQACA